MDKSCGVIRVDVPWLTGNQFLISSVALAIICLAGGLALIEITHRKFAPTIDQNKEARYALLGTIFTGTFMGYAGYWLFGLLCLVGAVIITFVSIFKSLGGF